MNIYLSTLITMSFLLNHISVGFGWRIGRGTPPPLWKFMNEKLKTTARQWFIKRAEKSGIPWTDLVKHYENRLDILESYKEKYENTSIQYPNYYTQSFHGYDKGNLEWKAALEVQAATLSISSRYWPKLDPIVAEQYMRNNATESIQSYWKHHNPGIPVQTIMDMGSSTGISTKFIQRSFPEAKVLGVELSPYFLAVALYDSDMTDDSLHFLHANAEDVPLDDESFDIITCQFLFHEVPYWNQLEILKEAHRLLKVGGVLAILDLNPYDLRRRLENSQFRLWAFESTEPHIFDYYQNNMKRTVQECGFESVVQMKNDPMNMLWMGKKTGVRIQTPKQSVAYSYRPVPSIWNDGEELNNEKKKRKCPGKLVPCFKSIINYQ